VAAATISAAPVQKTGMEEKTGLFHIKVGQIEFLGEPGMVEGRRSGAYGLLIAWGLRTKGQVKDRLRSIPIIAEGLGGPSVVEKKKNGAKNGRGNQIMCLGGAESRVENRKAGRQLV